MSPRLLPLLSIAATALGFQLAGGFSRGLQPSTVASAKTVPPPVVPVESPSLAPATAASEAAVRPSGELGALPKGSLRELTLACEKAGSPAATRLALMEAISHLKPDELRAMLAKETAGTDFYRSNRFDFQFAAKRLSEIAPEKAAALWLDARATHYSVDVLLGPWAKKDPVAFASWSAGLAPDAQKAVGQTLAKSAAEQPEQFLGIAPQLAQGPAGILGARGAISGFIAKAAKGEDPSNALAYAQSLPAGPTRAAALAELARWPGMNVAAYPEVAAALAQLSPAEARRYARQVDPEALPPSALRESAYANQLAKAAQKDPQAAAKKVDALSKTADYPAAVRGFVEATAAKDPAAAIEWALTIGVTGAQRSAALEKAATEYFRLKPADARKWVEKAPLTPEEYQMLTGRTR
jgi:hypothetical protein